MHLKRTISILIILMMGTMAEAQEPKLEELTKFDYSGGINASTTFYNVSGIPNRRDPFFWMINANLTFQLGPISMPFSASISTQSRNFTHPQPFNRVGISPKYKAFTAHLGYRSLQFSEFSLGGAEFLGIGIEYQAKGSSIKATALYGRFQKAGRERSYTGVPLYERWGYGTKLNYNKKDTDYSLILFKAKDDPNSLPDSLADSLQITPADNLVIGNLLRQTIKKNLSLEVEYTLSAFTRDIRTPELVLENYTYINNFGNIYQPRASSYISDALQASVAYSQEKYQVNLSYRRVDPDYITLGAPFLTNDFQDITVGGNVALWEGKVNLAAQAGFQKNDLKNERLNQTKRAIGNFSVAYQASEKLNINGSFANFNTSTQMAQFVQSSTGIDPDTLFFSQVNNNGNLNLTYQIPGEKVQQSYLLAASYQQTVSSQQGTSNFFNINLAYNLQNSGKYGLNVALNANNTQMVGAQSASIGPVVSFNKGFMDNKLRSMISLVQQQTYNMGELTGALWAARCNLTYPVSKKQNMAFNAAYTHRHNNNAEKTTKVKELRATLNYQISF